MYKSQLIEENEFESRQSAVFDMIADFVKQEYRDELPTVRFQSGAEYVGEWVQDNMDGKGRLVFSDGVLVEGEFAAGKVNGRAKI